MLLAMDEDALMWALSACLYALQMVVIVWAFGGMLVGAACLARDEWRFRNRPERHGGNDSRPDPWDHRDLDH